MRTSSIFWLGFPLATAVAGHKGSGSTCHFKPPVNATASNYPGATAKDRASFPYDVNVLSTVPVASVCTSKSGNATEEKNCARQYIDAIDEQLAFLYARRLGYAAVAGNAKYRNGTDLNDPSRNTAVANGMAELVVKYGGSAEAGRLMGGEGCQIYASLLYEIQSIQDVCDSKFEDEVSRSC